MSPELIAAIFLSVSYIGFTTQMVSLLRIIKHPLGNSNQPVYHSLIRTASCRVAAAVLYIFIGTNALFFGIDVPVVTLGTFCAIQVMWMFNSLIDVQLKHKISGGHHHGRP